MSADLQTLEQALHRTRAGLGSGLEMAIPGRRKTHFVNVPVEEPFARQSPWLLVPARGRHAYHVVREHFALLGEVAREFEGTIVKTIGDGIHAAFNAPETAFRAAIAMQQKIADFNRNAGREQMLIRVGLHTGSSISVTLNERLDYYGSTVNLAARLEGLGDGGDITMSEAFVNDVAVQPLLQGYEVRERVVSIRGFDEDVRIYQITP